jgi:hypothetical protein
LIDALRGKFDKKALTAVRGGYSDPVTAMNHALLGDNGAALDSLEKAIEMRVFLAAFAKADPVFDGLRDDPRFKEIIRK